jgi:flagellar biosynthetic protein FliR
MSYTFILLLVRSSTMVVTSPVFSHRGIPAWTKVGFSIFLALLVTPLLQESMSAAPETLPGLIGPVARELIFGLALGLTMQLIFISAQMGAHLLGLQLGFGLGGVFDPQTGSQFGPFDQFFAVLATLLFFAVNGHHHVIRAFAETATAVPPGTFNPFILTEEGIAGLAAGLLVTAVRISFPVVAAAFLTDVGMGLVARTAPQTNILVVGAPIKIGVGMLVLMAALPATAEIMRAVFEGPMTGASQNFLGVR